MTHFITHVKDTNIFTTKDYIMKKVIKLTESDLTKLISKVINESLYENDLYSKIMNVIRNSNSSKEETLEILHIIIDQMESAKKMRSRFKDKNFEN